jgi:hypothetical protein
VKAATNIIPAAEDTVKVEAVLFFNILLKEAPEAVRVDPVSDNVLP